MEIEKPFLNSENSSGVLAIQQIQKAVESGIFVVPEEEPIPVSAYQPASLAVSYTHLTLPTIYSV